MERYSKACDTKDDMRVTWICRTPDDDDACYPSHVQCTISGGAVIFVTTTISASMSEWCSPHFMSVIVCQMRDVEMKTIT